MKNDDVNAKKTQVLHLVQDATSSTDAANNKPASALAIESAVPEAIFVHGASSGTGTQMTLLRSKGSDATAAAPTVVAANDVLGALSFQGVVASSPAPMQRRDAVVMKGVVSATQSSVSATTLGGELHLLVARDATDTMPDVSSTGGGTKINSKGELQTVGLHVGSAVTSGNVLNIAANALTSGSGLSVGSSSRQMDRLDRW